MGSPRRMWNRLGAHSSLPLTGLVSSSVSLGNLTLLLISMSPLLPGTGSHGTPTNLLNLSAFHRSFSSDLRLKSLAFTTPSLVPITDSPLSSRTPNHTPSCHLTSNLSRPAVFAGRYSTHSPNSVTGRLKALPFHRRYAVNPSLSFLIRVITDAACATSHGTA